MNCPPARTRRQRGAALIVAMLVFAMSAALVVSMQGEFDLFYRRGANALAAEQAWSYLRSAEELAGLALVEDWDQDQLREQPRDDLTELWAQPAVPYPLEEGGWLQGGLTDLQGRFNLNGLRPTPPTDEQVRSGEPLPYSAAQEQFMRLLQSFEEPQVSEQEARLVTESIGDWIDENSVAGNNGAEDDYYYDASPPYRSANRPLFSVTELRAVAYVTPELYRALEPLVTVWPREPAKMNIHTAPVQLLQTINGDGDLTPLTAGDAQSLAQLRDDGLDSLDTLLEHPAFRDKPMEKIRTLLGENSSYFLLSARAEVAGRESGLYSVLRRSDRQVTALVRYSGLLQTGVIERNP